jgi:hypothetical protein
MGGVDSLSRLIVLKGCNLISAIALVLQRCKPKCIGFPRISSIKNDWSERWTDLFSPSPNIFPIDRSGPALCFRLWEEQAFQDVSFTYVKKSTEWSLEAQRVGRATFGNRD